MIGPPYLGSASTTTKEQDTVTLRASHRVAGDPNAPSPWTVTYDNASKIVVSGTCLGISLGQMLQLGPNGATGGFMFVLGDVQIESTRTATPARTTVSIRRPAAPSGS